MAEVSARGDVNVSSFPGRSPGCGGFIDISQSARKVVFVGTFTSGGLHVRVDSDGGGGAGRRNGSGGSSGGSGNGSGEKRSLSISSEGRHPKFKASVGEVTFAGSSAGGREVVYVTERALFRLREVVERVVEGLEVGEEPRSAAAAAAAAAGSRRKRKTKTIVELCEVAPGIDVERDVLSKMAFRPAIPEGGVRVMDQRVLEGV